MTDSKPESIVHRENRHGVEKPYVRVDLGTSVVEVPARINNPITERTEDLRKLSEDGYCRRFLALYSASNSPDHVDLGSSPVLTFDKDRWELEETEGSHVLVKKKAENPLDEIVLEGSE